jgi:hypothetical protein
MKCKSIYCDREPVARGLCSKHHARWIKGDDINVRTYSELTVKERFNLFIRKNKVTKCWHWIGGKRGNPDLMYGIFCYQGKNYSAHRFSWMLHKGELNKEGGDYRGMCVCHHCDNPICVNPKHLFLATHKENMQDKVEKGRCGQKSKVFCKYGHMFTEGNTWISKEGSRHCKTCHRKREKERQARLRAGG